MTRNDEEWLPDPAVARRYGVSLMTLWRWDQDPSIGFPPKVKFRGRNRRSRRMLEEFDAALLRRAMAGRAA